MAFLESRSMQTGIGDCCLNSSSDCPCSDCQARVMNAVCFFAVGKITCGYIYLLDFVSRRETEARLLRLMLQSWCVTIPLGLQLGLPAAAVSTRGRSTLSNFPGDYSRTRDITNHLRNQSPSCGLWASEISASLPAVVTTFIAC